MPELPEVETTRRGIEPHILKQQIEQIIVRQPRLRWPVPDAIQQLQGATIQQVDRRAKYLLLQTEKGVILLHLGMSGSLRITTAGVAPEKHDHIDLVFANGLALRLRDPRRFGAMLYSPPDVLHPLLAKLGVEPLDAAFDGDYLYQRAHGRSLAIKALIMDAHQVVGVGNIYANEALFMAGIHPERASKTLTTAECTALVTAIKWVLSQALQLGGTTLRDFVREDGRTGYFQTVLQVYGRHGGACLRCETALLHIRQGQRSTWYCPCCQPVV